jgi:hypothetical protein
LQFIANYCTRLIADGVRRLCALSDWLRIADAARRVCALAIWQPVAEKPRTRRAQTLRTYRLALRPRITPSQPQLPLSQ